MFCKNRPICQSVIKMMISGQNEFLNREIDLETFKGDMRHCANLWAANKEKLSCRNSDCELGQNGDAITGYINLLPVEITYDQIDEMINNYLISREK